MPPPKSAPITYLDAIRVPLLVQRVICLSPFRRRGDRLVSSAAITCYSVLYLAAFLATITVSSVLIYADEFAWHATIRHGYLWVIISTFEVIFTMTTYPVLLVYALLARNLQMETMMFVDALDGKLRRVFGVDLNRFYVGFVRRQNAELFAWLLYFAVMYAILTAVMQTNGFSSVGFALFAFTYQMEQCSTGLLSWSITNSMKVLWSKFGTLRRVQRQLMRAADAGQFAGAGGAVQLKRQLAVLMRTFKDLCDVIDKMSERMGALFVLRYAHDFTLVTSQCYLVYWLLAENGTAMGGSTWALLGSVVLWMWQNVARIGLTALWASWTVEEVSIGWLGGWWAASIDGRHFIIQAYRCGHAIVRSSCSTMDDDIQHMVS